MDDRPVFDAAKFKTTTRAQWQAAADAWRQWGPFLGEWLGAATEQMFDLARIKAGSRVLDVAAGAGEQSIAAARRVGASGHVLATDIAPALLDHARADARAAGLSNVETRELDGEALSELPAASFDAAISRVGLIYFPDQQRALAGIRHALKPGGRFAAIVYSTPDKNQFFSIPVGIIRRRAKLPPPAAGPTGPVFTRRRWRVGSGVRARRPARHRGAQGRLSGATTERSRMRALRARIVWRSASDDEHAQRNRARRNLGRDRT